MRAAPIRDVRRTLAAGRRPADTCASKPPGRNVAQPAKVTDGGRGVSFGVRSLDSLHRFRPCRRRRGSGDLTEQTR